MTADTERIVDRLAGHIEWYRENGFSRRVALRAVLNFVEDWASKGAAQVGAYADQTVPIGEDELMVLGGVYAELEAEYDALPDDADTHYCSGCGTEFTVRVPTTYEHAHECACETRWWRSSTDTIGLHTGLTEE